MKFVDKYNKAPAVILFIYFFLYFLFFLKKIKPGDEEILLNIIN